MQKAFCKDFDRLTNARIDLATELRAVPAPSDGDDVTFDPPPSVSAGEDADTGAPPIVDHGFAYLRTSDGVGPFIFPNEILGESDYTLLYQVFALQFGAGEVMHAEDIGSSDLFVEWAAKIARIHELWLGVLALNAWAATIPTGEESVDNSATRAALAECLRRLADLESAFAETFRKWREH